MRKGIVLNCALAAAFFCSPAWGQSRLDRIKADGVMRVCIWPDYYSITYRDARTGALQGIDIEMAGALAAELGVAATFVDSSFKTLVADLTEDKCDVSMHGVGVTAARQEKLDFTRPYLKSGVYAITSRTNPTVAEWADIDKPGVVVAAQAGTYMVEVMQAELKQATLVVVATSEAREQEVMSGRADLFVTDYPYSRKVLARHPWAKLLAPPRPLAATPYAYAVAKGDPAWLAVLDDFVERAGRDGRLLRSAINNGLEAIVINGESQSHP